MRESDPLHLRAGYRKFRLHFHQGLVEGYESNTGGFNEGFWLRGEHGWYQVGVQGAYARIPEGHLTTAVDAHGPRERLGYVVFFDHDAPAIRPVEGTLRSLFAPRRWLLVPVLGLASLWGASSTAVPADTPVVRGLLAAVLAWLVTAAVLRWVAHRRLRRFLRKGAGHILAPAAESAEALRRRIPVVAPPPPPLPTG